MGVQNFIGQLAYVVTPWFLWVMQYEPLFDDLVSGAAGLSVAIGLFTIGIGVLPAIFLRERYKEVAAPEGDDTAGSGFRHSMAQFFQGFLTTLKFCPFLKLCAATFLVFNGFILVSSFQAYVIAFGLGCLFTVMPSMIADVCDLDELETHERREGMFGSIFWWVVKLGMALALAGGGVLLNATGFDVDLEGAQTARTIFLMRLFDAVVPMVSSSLAIWAIATHTLSEEKAYQVRKQLEESRGVLAAG